MTRGGSGRRALAAGMSVALALAIVGPQATTPSRALGVENPPALAQPELVGPIGTTVADTVVELAWNRVPGATGYHVVVRHLNADGPIVAETSTVNDRWLATVNLAGDTAWWGVAAISTLGLEGEWSGATFTTARVAPTLAWPPDGATITHPDAWPDLAVDRPIGDLSSVRATQAAGEGVPAEPAPTRFATGSWRWGLSAAGTSGDPVADRPEAGPRTFTMAWRDGTPLALEPADGSTLAPDESLRLRWTPVPGAARYQWRVVRPGTDTAVAGGSTLATWADVRTEWYPEDLAGGQWEWQVRAVMSYSEDWPSHPGSPVFGPWSETASVTLPAIPQAATPAAPADGAALDHWPVLAWSAVPGNHGYVVELNDAPEPVDDPMTGYSSAADGWFSFAAPGGSPNPMAVAAPGTTTRYWRIRTVGTLYDTGEQSVSPWRSFTVTTGTPLASPEEATLLAPADCATDACDDLPGRPLLTWEPVAGAAFYRVFVRWSGGDGAADEWFDTGSAGLVLPADAALSPTTRVAWNVVACTADACPESMPATRRQFRVTFDAPVQAGPADGTVQAAPAVEMAWAPAPVEPGDPAVVRPRAYQVEWLISPGEHGDAEDRWTDWTPFTHATEPDIADGSVLRWRVRTYEQPGWDPASRVFGAWSPFRTITRDVPPLELLNPADGAVLADAPAVLDWSERPFPVGGYIVELAKDTTLDHWGPEHWDWSAGTGATSIRIPALAPGVYRWRVTDADDWAWSTGWFTVSGDPRPQVTAPLPGDTVRADDAFFAWEPYPAHQWFASLAVQVATTPAFEPADIVRTWSVDPRATSLAATEALPTGDLYWRVCATWDCSIPNPVGAGVDGGGGAVAAGTAVPDAPVDPAPGLPMASTPRLLHVTAAPGPDTTAPVVGGITMVPILGRQLGSGGSTPVRLTWTATDVGSGVWAQAVRIRRGTGAWTTLPVSGTRSATTTILPGVPYTIQVRATDRSGNVGTWVQRSMSTYLRQETASGWTWSGRWTRSASSSALGDATRWSTQAGATATRQVTASAIGVVTPKGATRGTMRVYVDGGLVATVRLDASPLGARRLAWVGAWPTAGSHRITIKVVGTSGHPRVDVDGVVVIR